MLENVYEVFNARSKVYLSEVYFCEMYLTCLSSKLCEFIATSTDCVFARVLLACMGGLNESMSTPHKLSFHITSITCHYR